MKGTLVFDIAPPILAKLVRSITWKFEEGKTVSFEGDENIELLGEKCEHATGDKDKVR